MAVASHSPSLPLIAAPPVWNQPSFSVPSVPSAIRDRIHEIRWEVLPPGPHSSYLEPARINRIAGQAFIALGALSFWKTVHLALFFTAAPATVIRVVVLFASMTVTSFIFGFCLLKKQEDKNSPEARLAKRQQLKNHLNQIPRYPTLIAEYRRDAILTKDEINALISHDLATLPYDDFIRKHTHDVITELSTEQKNGLKEKFKATFLGKGLLHLQHSYPTWQADQGNANLYQEIKAAVLAEESEKFNNNLTDYPTFFKRNGSPCLYTERFTVPYLRSRFLQLSPKDMASELLAKDKEFLGIDKKMIQGELQTRWAKKTLKELFQDVSFKDGLKLFFQGEESFLATRALQETQHMSLKEICQTYPGLFTSHILKPGVSSEGNQVSLEARLKKELETVRLYETLVADYQLVLDHGFLTNKNPIVRSLLKEYIIREAVDILKGNTRGLEAKLFTDFHWIFNQYQGLYKREREVSLEAIGAVNNHFAFEKEDAEKEKTKAINAAEKRLHIPEKKAEVRRLEDIFQKSLLAVTHSPDQIRMKEAEYDRLVKESLDLASQKRAFSKTADVFNLISIQLESDIRTLHQRKRELLNALNQEMTTQERLERPRVARAQARANYQSTLSKIASLERTADALRAQVNNYAARKLFLEQQIQNKEKMPVTGIGAALNASADIKKLQTELRILNEKQQQLQKAESELATLRQNLRAPTQEPQISQNALNASLVRRKHIENTLGDVNSQLNRLESNQSGIKSDRDKLNRLEASQLAAEKRMSDVLREKSDLQDRLIIAKNLLPAQEKDVLNAKRTLDTALLQLETEKQQVELICLGKVNIEKQRRDENVKKLEEQFRNRFGELKTKMIEAVKKAAH